MANIWQLEKLSVGDLELVVLPGIGGRLWDIVFQGRSLLFQNDELQDFIPNPNDLGPFPTRSPQFFFPLWGGEKTWIAPDSSWPSYAPYPVLDSGAYDVLDAGTAHIALQSAICPQSGLQIERWISIKDNAEWTIQHAVTNQGDSSREVGIWSVMMMKHSARIGVAGDALGISPVFGEPGRNVTSATAGVLCDCDAPSEFKVGIENPSGRTFIRLADDRVTTWMICETAPPDPNQTFAHSHPLEVFNSGDYPYCEAEWHSPLEHLKPKATMLFTQEFSIWSDPAVERPIKLSATELELMKCMS